MIDLIYYIVIGILGVLGIIGFFAILGWAVSLICAGHLIGGLLVIGVLVGAIMFLSENF